MINADENIYRCVVLSFFVNQELKLFETLVMINLR